MDCPEPEPLCVAITMTSHVIQNPVGWHIFPKVQHLALAGMVQLIAHGILYTCQGV